MFPNTCLSSIWFSNAVVVAVVDPATVVDAATKIHVAAVVDAALAASC